MELNSTDMKACQETTDTDIEKETDPRMMQSVGEHQEVPKEVAIVKTIKRRKKWHRSRKLIAGRHGEPKMN
jgi:hypothetical protein